MYKPSRWKPLKKSPNILLPSQLEHSLLKDATHCTIHHRPAQELNWFPLHVRVETMCDYQESLRKRYKHKDPRPKTPQPVIVLDPKDIC